MYTWCQEHHAQVELEDHIIASHKGGGDNPQCLTLDPNFFKKEQKRIFTYRAYYEQTNQLVAIANSHDKDVSCAVAYVHNILYMSSYIAVSYIVSCFMLHTKCM